MVKKIINVEKLNKSFGDKDVLRDIDMSLYESENLVILGKSGSGKSVLIKCIVRLIDPDSGKINILGENMMTDDTDKVNAIRRNVGFLFQGAAIYDSMSVRENLEFPLTRTEEKKDKKKVKELVHEALENVGLQEAINKLPSELSGGMRKRLGLARTLILKPKIILYDEPTTGLDPVTSQEISGLILEIQEKYNASSIIITHDMSCAKMTGNRIKMLKDARFYAEGKYDELEKSDDEEVNSYFKY